MYRIGIIVHFPHSDLRSIKLLNVSEHKALPGSFCRNVYCIIARFRERPSSSPGNP